MKLQKVSSEALAMYCVHVQFHGTVFSYLSTSCCDISYLVCCRQSIFSRFGVLRYSTEYFHEENQWMQFVAEKNVS
jgi:hypothetical protein